MAKKKHWFWPALKALFLAGIFYKFARSFLKMALKQERYEERMSGKKHKDKPKKNH